MLTHVVAGASSAKNDGTKKQNPALASRYQYTTMAARCSAALFLRHASEIHY